MPLLGYWTKRAIILALLPLLAACSALRLAYSTAPDLSYWWADRYLDFSADQAPQVRSALAEFFAWHRATQVPDYVALLSAIRQQAAGALTPQQVCQRSDELNQRLDTAFERALPALAEVALTLTPANLAHLERRYRRGNEEFRAEYAQADAAERREATWQRALKRFEDWYGRLDDAQRRDLAVQIAASPFDTQAWLAEREWRQQDVLATLRTQLAAKADAARMQQALRSLTQRQIRSPRPAYRAYQDRLTAYNCALVARLHNTATPAQRQYLQDRLKGYEEDLRSIAGLPGRDG